MIDSPLNPINSKIPKFWITWLSKDCPVYSRKKFIREPHTAMISEYDSTEHDQAKIRVRNELEQNGYTVIVEKWLVVDYDDYTVGTRLDVYASHPDEKKILIVEIKPQDRSYNEPQYIFMNVLLEDSGIDANFFVYSYKSDVWIPKIIKGIPKARDDLFYRVQLILDNKNIFPVPSKFCDYCPYASCSEHPQHSDYQNTPEFLKKGESPSNV